MTSQTQKKGGDLVKEKDARGKGFEEIAGEK